MYGFRRDFGSHFFLLGSKVNQLLAKEFNGNPKRNKLTGDSTETKKYLDAAGETPAQGASTRNSALHLLPASLAGWDAGTDRCKVR